MTHQLRILRRAREDAQHIFDYISARSFLEDLVNHVSVDIR